MRPLGIGPTCWALAPPRGGMRRLNLFFFHNVGFALGHLTSTAPSDDMLTHWRWATSLDSARSWLQSFGTQEPPLMPKSQTAAWDLIHIIDDFKTLLGQDRKATLAEWTDLTNGVMRFNNVYEQEVEDAHILCVTSIGAYSTSVLMENAYTHLSAQAQKKVHPQTKTDLNSSGRCLALDLPTASGFHAMRAVEAEARLYHQIVTSAPEPLSDVPLGPVINGKKGDFAGLRDQFITEGQSNDSSLGLIISMLSHVNKIYRCPITHPDMTLDYDGAKHVFDLATVAISAIISDGEERKRAKASKLIALPAP